MPIYTYKCNTCSRVFDILEGVTQDAPAKKCPQCGSQKIQKQLSAFNVGSAPCPASYPSASCGQKSCCASCPKY